MLLVDNHFFLVTDLIHFMADGHTRPSQSLIYQHCLCWFTTQEALTIHEEVCEHPLQKLVYLTYDKPCKFDSCERRVAVPIFGVADFEAGLAPISSSQSAAINNCSACAFDLNESLCDHATRNTQEHVPTTFYDTIFFLLNL